jgi:ribose transport system substrate-binding protein
MDGPGFHLFDGARYAAARGSRRTLCLLFCAVAVAAVTGVSARGGNVGNSAAAKSASSCVDQAVAGVKAAKAAVPLIVPSRPLDLSKLKGKKVALVLASKPPSQVQNAEGFVAAAKAAGVSAKVYDGKYQVTVWNQVISEAVSQRVDGIATIGTDPRVTSQPVAAARKQGIPIVDSYARPTGAPLYPGVIAQVAPDYNKAGRFLADWVLADSACKASLLLLTDTVYPVLTPLVDSASSLVKRRCPTCSVLREKIDATTIATTLNPRVSALLRAHPDINYIIVSFDPPITFIRQAVANAGREIKVLGMDGNPENLSYIRTGKGQQADVAPPPNQWQGWMIFDQLARAMTHVESRGTTISLPFRLVDSTNIGAADPGRYNIFPSYRGFQKAFVKAWNK